MRLKKVEDTKMAKTNTEKNGSYLLVSKSTASALAFHAMQMLQKHLRLIQMINEESRLKKQHKSTVDIRECIELESKDAEAVLKAFSNALLPAVKCEHSGLPFPMRKNLVYNPETCANCQNYPNCKAAMSDYWAFFWAAFWDDSKLIHKEGFRELSKNTYFLSEEQFELMDKDFFGVCTRVDGLMSILNNLLEGHPVSEDELKNTLAETDESVEKAFERWFEGEYEIAE